MATTKAMTLSNLLDNNGDVVASSLDNASSLFGLPTGWTITNSGSDLVFAYNSTTKFKIGTDGSIVAMDSITAIDDVIAFGSA